MKFPSFLFCLATAMWIFATAVVRAEPVTLTVKEKTITVHGRKASIFAIEQDNGERGITVEEKDGFHVLLKNATPVPTSIHWHGLILPNLQDGVPYVTQKPIPPGGEQEYSFPLVQHGTYWMHSHYGLQEQILATAPLIILNDGERAKADRDVVLTLADFSFKCPIEILDALKKSPVSVEQKMAVKSDEGMQGMVMSPEKMPARVQVWDEDAGKFTSKIEEKPKTDIDVEYDALLGNLRTADDPEIVRVKPGESVLLRIIASSSATNFFVDTGMLDAELLAVDGKAVEPLRGNFFQLAIAQRIDLRVVIPKEGGAFSILGLGEGTRRRAGLILATAGAAIPELATESPELAGALDNTQEVRLRAVETIKPRKVDRELPSVLGGSMQGYEWSINGKSYPNRNSLDVKAGERVEMTLTNKTMMSHPMHLHGHDFTVVEIDGQKIFGAMRDTLLVPPGGETKIQFDANNPGIWAYHCHVLYHMVTGMFTVLKYDGADTRFWEPEKTPGELTEKLP